MDLKKVFKNFYTKDQKEIICLIKKFIEEDFFKSHPELKNTISILITGSISSCFYNKKSDIDLTVIFPNKSLWQEYKPLLLQEYMSANMEQLRPPLSLHRKNITYFEQIKKELGTWTSDWMLREFSDAIIMHDPADKAKKLIKKYKWYPDEIYLDKVNSLFSGLTYLILIRLKGEIEVNASPYNIELTKLNSLKMIISSFIIANYQYPPYEKHLFHNLAQIGFYVGEEKIIDAIIKETDARTVYKLLVNLRSRLEKILIGKKLIARKNIRYWIGMRPKFHVNIGT